MKRCTEMAYKDADDMVFGHAQKPVKAVRGFEVGNGRVVPELNVAPGEGAENSLEKMNSEMKNIAYSACQRAVGIGLPAFQLEREHIAQQTYNPTWAAENTQIEVGVLEDFEDEYGLQTSYRATPADIRDEEKGMPMIGSEQYNLVMETMEACAENGASFLSIETVGGKSVSDYGIARADMKAILFGIGVLGSMDMQNMWTEIVKIAGKT
ncbi:MAG: methanol--corrinoid methyltransferase, partial [Methanobacteriaceae archaeon]|nr:methanol--corrinoid methyltransferase [Methanobacteriaceae archaeon]